jgi:starvation-inducible DNA-binding protein
MAKRPLKAAAKAPVKKTPVKKAAKAAPDGVNIGLTADVRAKVVSILNTLLADEFTLYARARAFHWNVTGRNFKADHALFEDEYEYLDEVIDEVAERARALGGMAEATLPQFSKATRLPTVPAHGLSAEEMIRALLDGHEAVIRAIRIDSEITDDLDDEGTTDFLTGLMEEHEKRAWILRSHLG